MQEKNPGYIKDIEKYFLKVTGKGLMLSGKDYNLINSWQERSVSKETVFKAIQNSLKEKDLSKLRGIYSIEDNIEDYIKSTKVEVVTHKDSPSNLSKTNSLKPVLKKIDSIINSQVDDNVKSALIKTRYKIDQLKSYKTDNFYSELKRIESDFFDTLYKKLDNKSKQDIRNEAENKLPKEAKHFDKETKEKTVNAFRNEIVKRNFNLNNIFELK